MTDTRAPESQGYPVTCPQCGIEKVRRIHELFGAGCRLSYCDECRNLFSPPTTVYPVPASSREAADPKPQSCPLAEQHERMRSMLQRVEWVRQSAGNKYACPICRAIADRDGGPGHTDDCELHQAICEQGLFGKPAPAERGEARPPTDWSAICQRILRGGATVEDAYAFIEAELREADSCLEPSAPKNGRVIDGWHASACVIRALSVLGRMKRGEFAALAAPAAGEAQSDKAR